jgi:hypothetical protein
MPTVFTSVSYMLVNGATPATAAGMIIRPLQMSRFPSSVPAVHEDTGQGADQQRRARRGEEHATHRQGSPGLALSEAGGNPEDERGKDCIAQIGYGLFAPERSERAIDEQT